MILKFSTTQFKSCSYLLCTEVTEFEASKTILKYPGHLKCDTMVYHDDTLYSFINIPSKLNGKSFIPLFL